MNVSLTPELEKLVHDKIASGLYTSASEVVREALRLLAESDRQRAMRVHQLREEIAKGLAEANAGKLVDGPTAMALTRQKLPVFDRNKYASAEGLTRGAYVMSDSPTGKIDVIIIATGSEVSVAVEAQDKLAAEDIGARVVSMPCWELFDKQTREYRDEVLPPDVHARIAIEAGVNLGWERYVGEKGGVIGLDRYGASAPVQVVMEKLGFTAANAVERVKKLLGK